MHYFLISKETSVILTIKGHSKYDNKKVKNPLKNSFIKSNSKQTTR